MLSILTQLYNFIIRPILFSLPPETAQKIGTFPLRFKIPVKKMFAPINTNKLFYTSSAMGLEGKKNKGFSKTH